MPSLLNSIAALALAVTAVAYKTDSPFPMPLCKGVDIEDAHVSQLQKWMTIGRLSSQDLVECYLARIEQTNDYTHSISEINPDALHIAKNMDHERSRGKLRGPMHGIPFVSKDNFYTDDKHHTSEGTLFFLGGKYEAEATVVAKIREAGGVLLAHSTMSEAADHRALTDYASGYSSRTGQTRNPYNLTQPTAGSSSGSVVAVRANQAAIAIGSETYGSLVHPSAQLGLYTIKSTPGLLSRYGVVTGSYYHDTPGPLARSMTDVAMMLDIMKGIDPKDNLTFPAAGHYPEKGYSAEVVGKHALRGMKFGIPWDTYWDVQGQINAPGNREFYINTLSQLKAAGAEIYNLTSSSLSPNPFAEIINPYGSGHPSSLPPQLNHAIAFNTLLASGYASWLTKWTFPAGDPRGQASTIDDIIAWNLAHNSSTGARGNNTWWWNLSSGQDFYDGAAATGGSLVNSTFWTSFGWGRFTARQAIDQAHVYVSSASSSSEDGEVVVEVVVEELDGLLVPNGRGGNQGNACAVAPSYAGYPIAAVPLGVDGFGTPMGMCVYGRQYGEGKLVRVGSAMEGLFQWDGKPGWANWDTAEGPWDLPWPGWTCSKESLGRHECLPE